MAGLGFDAVGFEAVIRLAEALRCPDGAICGCCARRWFRYGLLFLMLTSACVSARVDPVTKRARVLYLGDTSYTRNKIVLDWVMAEPRFSLIMVPCDLEFMMLPDARKFTRLYLPRTYEALNSSYDVLVLHNISPQPIDKNILVFFQRGIEEEV